MTICKVDGNNIKVCLNDLLLQSSENLMGLANFSIIVEKGISYLKIVFNKCVSSCVRKRKVSQCRNLQIVVLVG